MGRTITVNKIAFATKRWLWRLMAVAAMIMVPLLTGNPAMADIGSIGPDTSVALRYNLTSYGTHPYTDLAIPIYFKYNPGAVTVEAFDFHNVGDAKASFNGGPAVGGSNYQFIVGGFGYDGVSGLYKALVSVRLLNRWGGTSYVGDEVYQFRLRLINPTDGWISYGGGRVSQADPEYWRYNPGGADKLKTGLNQEMFMALPCTIQTEQDVSVKLWDLDQPGSCRGCNGGKQIQVQIFDQTTGELLETRNGADYPVEMGNLGELSVGFRMKPGHLYRLLVSNIWVGNLIEYELPYDNISYATGCWSADGQSRVKLDNGEWKTGHDALPNVRPGSGKLYWNHTVRNSTSWDMPSNVEIHVDQYKGTLPNGSLENYNWTAYWGRGNAGVTFFDHTSSPGVEVTQDMVGYRWCEGIAWHSIRYNDDGWAHSDPACATVPYHYPGCVPGDPDCSNNPPDNPNPNGDCTQDGTCPDKEPTGGVDLTTNSNTSTIMPGEKITFTYNISNPSGPTKTKDVEYRTYTFVIPGGKNLPSNKDQMATYPKGWSYVACGGRDVPSSSTSYCAQGVSGNTGSINPGSGYDYHGEYTIDGNWLGQPGDQICSYIAANENWSVYDGNSANSYAASNISCVRIGKKPQLQLNGADSYAKQGFTGSTGLSDIDLNANRNSYSQYGLLTGSASAPITNFGSAGYTTVRNEVRACVLAYANSATIGSSSCQFIGKANLAHSLSSPTKPSTGLANYPGSLASLATGNNAYYYNGDLTINGGSLAPGTNATIYVKGDVTITGNISTYNDNANPGEGNSTNETRKFANASAIPSLTIVSETGDISISPSVTLVDANLVSPKGQFISCGGANNSTDLGINPSAKCVNKLKVNGSIISKDSPSFHRTYGSGNIATNPNQWNSTITSTTSEWVNYTPNNWLSSYLGAGNGVVSGYNTASVSSLPARY